MKKLMISSLVIILCLACEQNPSPDKANSTANDSLPATLFTKAKPADAISVAQARKLPAGSEVKVFGSIIGNKKPFVDGRAAFIIGDPEKLEVCTDACGAPWDCCCDDKKTIAAATLSIQVLNAKGEVAKASLKGQNGLRELGKVVVHGKVDAKSTADFMVINAEKIYVD